MVFLHCQVALTARATRSIALGRQAPSLGPLHPQHSVLSPSLLVVEEHTSNAKREC